jgi:uroporphyrinogen decarboxylase
LHAHPDTIRAEVKKTLDSFGPHLGHVFNLGHGITPDVLPESLGVLVDSVHELSARKK